MEAGAEPGAAERAGAELRRHDADALETGAGQLGAIRLRMLHCLWQGDGEGADRHWRQYELARVRTDLGVMYEGGLLFTELCALSCCDDLTRLRRIMPEIERWADSTPSWVPMLHYARAQQCRIGGDFERALESAREGLSMTAPGEHQLWPMLAGTELACLMHLGQVEAAVTAGRRYRQAARDQGMDHPALEQYDAIVLGHLEAGDFVITAIAVLALDTVPSLAQVGRLTAQLSRLGLGTAPDATRTIACSGQAFDEAVEDPMEERVAGG